MGAGKSVVSPGRESKQQNTTAPDNKKNPTSNNPQIKVKDTSLPSGLELNRDSKPLANNETVGVSVKFSIYIFKHSILSLLQTVLRGTLSVYFGSQFGTAEGGIANTNCCETSVY